MTSNTSLLGEANTEGENLDLGFPEPPPEWELNVFLNDIAEQIGNDAFRSVKHMFTGIIGKKVLDECQNIRDVFMIMRERRFLSHDNLLYLQSLIFQLGKPDLMEKCIKYSNRQGNVLHFYSPPDEPAPGHAFVKIHVEGRDFKNCNQGYLKKLRNVVARIVCIPEENVFFAGVEPSSSMLITFMIPCTYIKILVQMLARNDSMEELVEIGVDLIGIGDIQYNIRGIEEAEIILTEEQTALVSVYQQLQTISKQLEDRELECLQLSRKVDDLEKRNFPENNILATISRMFHSVVPAAVPSNGYQPATLASQAALVEFQKALSMVGIRGYDKELIFVLLQANTTVVVNRLKEGFHLTIRRFQTDVLNLKSQIVPMMLELEKYKFLVQVSSGKLDEILFESLVNAVKRNLKIEVAISTSIQIIEPSKKISNHLRFREKQKLMDKYQWAKDDPLKEALEKDPNMFLSILYLKEVEQTQTVSDQVTFITGSLEEVGRKDLVVKFTDLLKQSPKSVSQKQGKAWGRSTEKKGLKDRSTGSSRGSRDSEKQVDDMDLSKQLQLLSEKVDSMCILLESFQGKPPSYESIFSGIYPGYTKCFNLPRQQEIMVE